MVSKGALLVVVLFSWSHPAHAGDLEFVGVAQARGDSGFFHLNDRCEESFMGARLCTLTEAVQSSTRPAIPGVAWVWDGTVEKDTACHGWVGGPTGIPSDFPEYGGLTIDDSGSIQADFCNQTQFVACCTPIPEPAFANVPGLIPWAAAFLGIGMAISAMLMPRIQHRQLGHGRKLIGPGE